MQIAVIDIGTNTINLLVSSWENGEFQILHSSKIGAKLGKGTINDNFISPQAMQRGIEAIDNHLKTIRNFQVTKILAFATSAVRNATNGSDFTNEIQSRFGILVKTISGKEEARLIYEGVKPLLPHKAKKALILDIGGGSCEFVIANKNEIFWSESYELGMARLLEKFKPSDPIKKGEINEINQFFEKELYSLENALWKHFPEVLFGSSGSFDTLAKMAGFYLPVLSGMPAKPLLKLPLFAFRHFYKNIVNSTLEERMQMPGMDPVRVEFMVLAMLLIQHVISIGRFDKVFQSSYAIKEGIIFDYLKQPNQAV